MSKRWFVSDHHLGHYNIIGYAHRPFKTVKEMDETLLTLHNEYVKSNDHVSFLGDVTLRRGGRIDREWFQKEIKKYNGHKRLYLGNHDHFPIKIYIDAGFEKIYGTWRDQYGVIFSHFPLHPSTLSSAMANVHGHIHQNKSPAPATFIGKDARVREVPYINVSVEAIGYRPVDFDEIVARVEKGKDEWERVKV